MKKINIVPSATSDIDFITTAVFAAVKSGTDILTYSTLFEKSEEELLPLFKEMIKEDIEGQELWLSGFLLAEEYDGTPAATCCAWIEGEKGPSSMLTAQLLSFTLGTETYKKALEKQEVIESMRIDRAEGAVQIEHVYTAPNYRGRGLAARVIEKQIELYKFIQPEIQKAQIILFKTNQNALNAYTNMGFKIVKEQHSNHPQVLDYFPANTRVLMEKDI